MEEGTIDVLRFTTKGELKLYWKPLEGSSSFEFQGIPIDSVMLRFIPDRDAYPGYMSTYLGGTTNLEEASKFYLDKDTAGINITLMSVPPPPEGNADIECTLVEEEGDGGGRIINGRYQGNGTPVENVPVYLTQNDSEIVSYDLTDTNGQFEFEHIPVGNYEFLADYIGYSMDKDFDEITVPQHTTNLVFLATASGVSITLEVLSVTGFEKLNNNLILDLYPNPGINYLMIQLSKNLMPGTYSISIHDLCSRQVIQYIQEINCDSNALIVVPIDQLPTGLYLLTIKGHQILSQQKFIKTQ